MSKVTVTKLLWPRGIRRKWARLAVSALWASSPAWEHLKRPFLATMVEHDVRDVVEALRGSKVTPKKAWRAAVGRLATLLERCPRALARLTDGTGRTVKFVTRIRLDEQGGHGIVALLRGMAANAVENCAWARNEPLLTSDILDGLAKAETLNLSEVGEPLERMYAHIAACVDSAARPTTFLALCASCTTAGPCDAARQAWADLASLGSLTDDQRAWLLRPGGVLRRGLETMRATDHESVDGRVAAAIQSLLRDALAWRQGLTHAQAGQGLLDGFDWTAAREAATKPLANIPAVRAKEPEPSARLDSPVAQQPSGSPGIAHPNAVSTETGLQVSPSSAAQAVAFATEVTWDQGLTDVHVYVPVPVGTKAGAIAVEVRPSHLSVALRTPEGLVALAAGTLPHPVLPSESLWVVEQEGKSNTVHVVLHKKPGTAPWRTLFTEGAGEAKSHVQVLSELLAADDPLCRVDEMDDDAQDLLADLLDRQRMVASGELDLERGFDDFRIVLGDR